LQGSEINIRLYLLNSLIAAHNTQ